MARPTVLIVDDEAVIRQLLIQRLEDEGYAIVEAETAAEGLAKSDQVDLVLLDYRLPDGDGMTVLRQIKQRDPDKLVILLTGYSNVQMAVEAMKQGAYHYLNKPFNLDELALLVEKALETTRLRREVRSLRAGQAQPYGFDRIVGTSPAITAVKTMLRKVAASPASTILLTGESGTGKDLAAKVIHYNSPRAAKPFMNITCSALAEALLESELFGHERGAFTGADRQKLGLFEVADGGTVFLDEIGEMAPALQAKLLRVLEERAFKRVGGSADIRVEVCVIAATNRRLDEEVARGHFRQDLFYRLNVLPIELPPLRDRIDDLPLLVADYIDAYDTKFKKRMRALPVEAIQRLKRYSWPGNIRELRNVIERAILLAEGDTLTADDFGQLGNSAIPATGRLDLPAGGVDLEQLERSLVLQALERSNWNKTDAAALLGLNRDQIRYRIEKFQLERRSTPA